MNIWYSLLVLAVRTFASGNVVSIFPEQCSQYFYNNINPTKIILTEALLTEENHGTFSFSLWTKIIYTKQSSTIFSLEITFEGHPYWYDLKYDRVSSMQNLTFTQPYLIKNTQPFSLSVVKFIQTSSTNWIFVAISASHDNKSLMFYINHLGLENHISGVLDFAIKLNFETAIKFGGAGSFNGAISDFKIYNNINIGISDWNTQYTSSCLTQSCSSSFPSVSYGKCGQLCISQPEWFLPVFHPALYTDTPYMKINDKTYIDIKSTINIPDNEWNDYSITGWVQFLECQQGAFFNLRHDFSVSLSMKLINSTNSNSCDKLEAEIWTTDGLNIESHSVAIIGSSYIGNWFFFAVTVDSASKLLTLYAQNGANPPSASFPLVSSSIYYTNIAFTFLYKNSEMTTGNDFNFYKGNYADFRIYPGSHIDTILTQYNSNIYSAATYLDPHCVVWESIWSCQTCESGYFIKNGICQKCHPSCNSCSSDNTETNCLSCASGYYAQPGHPSMCFNYCPLGYALDSSLHQCLGNKGTIININFDDNLSGNFLSSNLYINLGTGSDNYYPDFIFTHPLPANKRGLFLDFGLIKFTPKSSTQAGRVFSSEFTLEIWIMIKTHGYFFVTSSNNDDLFWISKSKILLALGTNSDDRLVVDIQKEGTIETKYSPQWPNTGKSLEWAFYSVSFKFDEISQLTEILFVKNTNSEIVTMPGYYKEFPGMLHILGLVGKPPTMVGFIYSFAMYNYGKTYNEIKLSLGSCSSCTACPKNLNHCLPVCDKTEYADENGNCQKCPNSCSWICSRSDTCNLCFDDLCYKCSKYEIGACTQCVENAVLNSGQCECKSGYIKQESQCVDKCSDGFYFDASTLSCLSCPSNCLECSDGETCSICKNEFVEINGKCGCLDGYFLTSSNKCLKCDSSCLTCSINSSNCESCITDFPVLYDNKCYPCYSFEGFSEHFTVFASYFTNDLLHQLTSNCIEICGDGRYTGQAQCDDSNNNNGDGCSSNCTIETGWTCSGGTINSPDVCKDDTSPSPILAYLSESKSGYYLVLSFTENVNITSDLSKNIEIEIDDIQMFSWTILMEKAIYIIELIIYENVASGTSVTVIFIDPNIIIDLSGNQMKEKYAKVNLLSPFTYKISEVMETSVTAAVTVVAAGAVMSSTFLGTFNLQGLWGMIEMMQIQNYLIFLSPKYPSNLISYLRALSIANGNFLPNPFQKYIVKSDPFTDPPQKFIDENFNTDFLMNAGQFLCVWAITLAGLPICLILFKLGPRMHIIRWLRNSYLYAILLRVGIESFLEISLSVLLQLRGSSLPDQNIGYLSLILCYLTMIYLIVTFALIIWQVALKPKETLESKSHERQFGVLHEGFKRSSKLTASFLLFQNFRRVMFVASCVFLYDYTTIQVSISVILSFTYTILLILLRPYEKKYLGNCLHIICEILYFASNCLILKFLDNDISDSFREFLGWLIIALLGTSLLLHIISLLIIQTTGLIKGVKQFKDSFMKNFANKFVRMKRRVFFKSKKSYELNNEINKELKPEKKAGGNNLNAKFDGNFSYIDTFEDESSRENSEKLQV